MKAFLINILRFALPLLIIILSLEVRTRNYKTGMKQKEFYLSNNSDLIEVLFLGNSHAGDGIDPTQFSLNAFNAAQGSQSLYNDIEITKKYLPKMSSLKFVLISIDYHSFYFTFSPEREFMYSYYYGINPNENIPMKSYISLLFWGYGFKNGLSMIMKTPPKIEKGWVGYETTNYSTLNKLSGKKRVEFFDDMINSNIRNRSGIIENLNRFIVLLKSKGITPILFTLPCHDFLIQHLDEKILLQNNEEIENICRLHNIKYINYLHQKLPDTCFYNVDHLNKKGALIISKKINNYIVDLPR